MPLTEGQILPDSPLGKVLTKLAKSAKTIVEIGTGSGLGSTQCLLNGVQDRARLFCIEADPKQYEIALNNLGQETRCPITMYCGVIHHTIRPYHHPILSVQHREMWEHECSLIGGTNILKYLPANIDLLVLDGGEWTSYGDFMALWGRSRTIVLDDCNMDRSVKNEYAFLDLLRAKHQWERVHHEGYSDRNGWAVFERRMGQ